MIDLIIFMQKNDIYTVYLILTAYSEINRNIGRKKVSSVNGEGER